MNKATLLARTLVALAGSLTSDFDVVDLLTMVSDRCLDVLDVSAAGVMLAGPDGELRVVASSSETMRLLEVFEQESSEGPCPDCYRSGQQVVNSALEAAGGRWPHFGPKAFQAGFRSVHALPLRFRDKTIGALNLFMLDAGPLPDADITIAQSFADVATIAILQDRAACEAQRLNEQLTHALNSRVVIEQAKGVVAEAAGLDMSEAFNRLRAHARNHNLRLADVARAVATKELLVPALDG